MCFQIVGITSESYLPPAHDSNECIWVNLSRPWIRPESQKQKAREPRSQRAKESQRTPERARKNNMESLREPVRARKSKRPSEREPESNQKWPGIALCAQGTEPSTDWCLQNNPMDTRGQTLHAQTKYQSLSTHEHKNSNRCASARTVTDPGTLVCMTCKVEVPFPPNHQCVPDESLCDMRKQIDTAKSLRGSSSAY